MLTLLGVALGYSIAIFSVHYFTRKRILGLRYRFAIKCGRHGLFGHNSQRLSVDYFVARMTGKAL